MPKKVKKTQPHRKINLMLSNGLYVISATNREGTALYTLYITDFATDARITLDAENGRVLPNKHGIELIAKDMVEVVKAVGWEAPKKVEEAKPVEVEVVEAAGKKLDAAKEAVKKVSITEKLNSIPMFEINDPFGLRDNSY